MFTQSYQEGLQAFNLSITHFKALHFIMSQPGAITFYNNRIAKIDYQEISSVLKITYGSARNLISDCRKHGWVLKKEKFEYINPTLLYNGKTSSLGAAKRFLETEIEKFKKANVIEKKQAKINLPSKEALDDHLKDFLIPVELSKNGLYPYNTESFIDHEIILINAMYNELGFDEFRFTEKQLANPIVQLLIQKNAIVELGEYVYELSKYKYSFKNAIIAKEGDQNEWFFRDMN